MDIPRSEYPRPQFVRNDWLCLNGQWQFEIDHTDDGLDRGLRDRDLTGEILVPFCPESQLSGVGNTDFMDAVWYRRTVTIPKAWAGREVLLHFQAVDYDAAVWVNGVEVASHVGGWCGFTCDLAGVAAAGEQATIVVRARDDHHQHKPKGKQTPYPDNRDCFYTRTTGIWQTVWLEPVPHVRLQRPRITPDVVGGLIRLAQPVANARPGMSIRATLSDDAGEICSATCPAGADMTPSLDLPIPADRRRLWRPADPHLYDLKIELLDEAGAIIDSATSYAGLRSVTIDGKAIKINGETIFQRLVLDQGYYLDGIMTAPSEQALIADIELSLAAGFNGARLHQKVFEERFLYHADRLGYLAWGEFGDWGVDPDQPQDTIIAQWREVVRRDYSHPCIVGWCPLNETHRPGSENLAVLDDLTRGLFEATRDIDATRPVLDSSGYCHRVAESDVYDSHDYDQNPDTFRVRHAPGRPAGPFVNDGKRIVSLPYGGQPYFVSEFGGIWWNEQLAATAADGEDNKESWGYGDRVRNVEQFYARLAGLCDVLLDNPDMFGYCYTQLTDVFQEQNGLYDFGRNAKFDMERIKAIQTRPAAIEKIP